jgi:tRNA pseudouridine38-40 synthase
MPRYKLTLEYDGAPFVGWQRQANGLSVQEALEAAFVALCGVAIAAHGAGRTDAGVHASGHVDLEKGWDGRRLREALNAHLVPQPIAVLSAELVAAEFDARHSARMRHYLYRIVNRRAPLTIERGRAWHVKRVLDAEAMDAAAQALIGRHDFSTFRDSQCQAASPVRTLTSLNVKRSGDLIELRVSALSFLHRQVRSMVGSLEHVGAGYWSAGDLKAALDAADRSRCGQVAPACGLYLAAVDYACHSRATDPDGCG